MNLCISAILLIWSATAYDRTFEDALERYEQKDYAGSARIYEQMLSQGIEDARVFYNLANAYYRDQKLGLAIANYERALRVDPGMENARQNLAQCVAQTDRRLPRPPLPVWESTLFFWNADLRPDLIRTMALTAWAAAWLALAIRKWRPIPYLRRTALACALLAAMLGASLCAKALNPDLAVAAFSDVPVRYGDHDDEAVRFWLQEGDRAIVDEERGDWIRVHVADGERGWTKLTHMMIVAPPYLSPETLEEPAPDELTTPNSEGEPA